jgi:prevent-host-death family protein
MDEFVDKFAPMLVDTPLEARMPMYRVKGDSTIATITDLRRSANDLLDRVQVGESVVVQRNAEPVGVLVGYETYQTLVAVAEKLEDLELLVLARERERALINGEDRLIPLEEVMREYGLTPGAHSEADS